MEFSVTQVLIALTAFFSGAAGILVFFKYKPGEKERVGGEMAEVQINVAQGSLNVAQGSIELVTKTLNDQFVRMDRELDELRIEFNAYREDAQGRMDLLSTRLRGVTAEKNRYRDENQRLTRRVTELESQVNTLKTQLEETRRTNGG